MSKIDDLIKKYCPNGVVYKNLEDVCDIAKGIQFNKKDMNETGSYPVINGGINPSGFIEQYNCEADTITISQGGASAGYVNFLTTKFWAGAHCYTIKPCSMVLNRFLYHFVKAKEYKLQECQYGAGIPALAKSAIASLQIPVPPLEVQREIVQILDSFTMLTAELSAELSARKKQYEFYRDQLLSFKKVSPPLTLEWKTLGEICDMKAGKAISASDISSEQSKMFPYPCYGGNGIRGYVACNNQNGEYCLIGRQGALCGNVCFATGTFYATEHAVVVKNDARLNNRFLFHLLTAMNLNQYKSQGAQPGLAVGNLEKLSVPVPPIDIQKRIAKVLDNFEAICSDLKIGLPAEIELRKKQYEYYRDMLLSFEPLGTVLAKQASKQASKQAIISLYQYIYGYAEITLGDIALDMYRGSGITRDQVTNEGIPCVRYGEIYTTYGIHFDKCVSHTNLDNIQNPKYFENGDIIFAITGESIEDIAKCTAYVGKEKCLAGGDTVVMKHEQNAKYLSYALSTTDAVKQKGKGKVKSKVVHSSVPSLAAITIPLPSLAEQERIVAILDRFDVLVNDISTGIPAEIEARKKQYEYYRDKLLTFPKAC